MPNYVPLHTHSDFSLLDGYGKIKEYIKVAKELGMIGLGLSDHGTASGLYEFITEMQKADLIPVPGVEFYLAPENPLGAKVKSPIYYGDNGIKDPKYDLSNGAYTHLTIFAYNNKGLENLFKLTSLSWKPENYYFKPRIDMNMISEHFEGLIVTTGCPGSEINKRFLLNQDNKAYEFASRLKSIFGENMYIEIMDHKMPDEELERILIPKQIKLSRDLDIPLIATNDSHYAYKKDAKVHERILAVQTDAKMKEKAKHEGGNRFAFSTEEYHIKSYDEMKMIFTGEIGEQALANTVKLAEKCKDIKLEYNPHLRPEIEIPEGFTPPTYFQKLIYEGFVKKRGNQSKEIQAESVRRIQNEFQVIHSNDFITYFLVVNDYIDYAHKNGIGLGAGRGSVGGSEIAYVLDISNTDPIRHDLLFERFLSPGRGSLYQIDYMSGESEEIAVSDKKCIYSENNEKVVYVHELNPGDLVNYENSKDVIKNIFVKQPGSAPDVDTDFHTEGREKVVQYCIDKYGEENVANIIAFGTFKAKRAFKAMCTINEIPFALANKASGYIPGAQGAEASLKDIMDPSSPRYKEGLDFRKITENPIFEDIIDSASELDGRISETGVHPCFVAGTLIKTSKGYKPIELIEIGESVLTHTNSYKEVVDVINNESDDLYTLATANSLPIEVTGNHPMYVREVIKEKSSELGVSGRYLLEPQWKNINELSIKNDVIGIPINMKSELPELPYDLPFENGDFWWIIGRYLGNGWYEEFESKRNRKGKDGTSYVYTSTTRKIIISVGKEDATRDILIDKLGSLFEHRIETSHRTVDKIFISPSKYPDLFNYLKTLGKYAHGKFVSEEIVNLPIEILNEFLEGYLSADGSKNDKGEVRFSTVSEKLLLGMVSVVNKVHKRHCLTGVDYRAGKMFIEDREVNVRDRYTASFTYDKKLKDRSFYEDGFLWVHISKLYKMKTVMTKTYNLSVINDNSYTVNNLIAHNCGVVISNKPLAGIVPLQVRQSDGKVITQWEYPELEALGLIKMDFLGLELIDTVSQTLKNIELTNEAALDPKYVRPIPNMQDLIDGPMDDIATYKNLQEGNTIGIFQLGSPGVRDLLKRAKPTKFEDIATITALYRPGPMSMNSHIEWADRVNGTKEIVSIDKDLKGTVIEDILSKTAGVLVFQESLMQIATRYAGMTPYESDLLRKAMGKKKIDLMMSLKTKFIEGAINNGSTKKLAEKVWETMEGFASYGFNLSHSVSYAINIYQSIYLKTHYPSEFMAALIQQGFGDPKKTKEYIQEAIRMKLKIGPVSINKSQVKMSSTGMNSKEKYNIIFGFSGVKQLSLETAELIVKERNENGLFTSVADFVKRMTKYNITKSPISNLALAGAFDEFNVSRKLVNEKAGMFIDSCKKQESKGLNLFDMLGNPGEQVSMAESIEIKGVDYKFTEMLQLEADVLGMFISGHPTSNLGHIARQYNPNTINQVLNAKNFKETFNVLGTVTQLVSKTTKAGNKSIAVMIDDGKDILSTYLPRELTYRIEKYEELEKMKHSKEQLKQSDAIKALLNDQSVIPLESIELNIPYVFTVKPRKQGDNKSLTVLNIQKIIPTHDGSLPFEIKVQTKEMLSKVYVILKKYEDKKGCSIRVHNGNTYSDLEIKVKLSLDFIIDIEKAIGKNNVITEGI